MKRAQLTLPIWRPRAPRIVVLKGAIGRVRRSNPLEQGIGEGENPVPWRFAAARCVLTESGCLGLQLELGGKFLLKLNIGSRPIANKYREGKMQRTLKRELKVLETGKRKPGCARCRVVD